MNKIRIAAIFGLLLFALGAWAVQYPGGGQPGQQPGNMPPGASSPNQQPGMPPSGSPQQSPGDMGQPSQQPGQQQPGQQADQQAQPRSSHGNIDDQVKVLAEDLQLTADQQTKVKSALEDQHKQATDIINNNSMQRDEKVQKIHALREATIAKVRDSLTDDQKKKFDQLVQQQNDRLRQQQGAAPGSTQPPSTQPPK